jgi:ComF family protein
LDAITRLLVWLGKHLLPARCLICGQIAAPALTLCTYCNTALIQPKILPSMRCRRCAVPLIRLHQRKITAAQDEDGALDCAKCIQKRPYFYQCVCAVDFNPAASRLVNQLKHQGRLTAIVPIAAIMTETIKAHYGPTLDEIDWAIAVPLHVNRLRTRGFNQAIEIAKPICKQLQIPLQNHFCIRKINTRRQQTAGQQAREDNLRGAFSATQALNGARIAIIDDVVTTGATVNALSKTLLHAGASRCDIWCFACTPRLTSRQ